MKNERDRTCRMTMWFRNTGGTSKEISGVLYFHAGGSVKLLIGKGKNAAARARVSKLY